MVYAMYFCSIYSSHANETCFPFAKIRILYFLRCHGWSYLIIPNTQVIGDASADASKLMKREGVRSVPSFHYFMNGEKVEVVNGANAEAIEASINKYIGA